MAYKPPFAPLDRDEVIRRVEKLRAEGKPLTFENIDPEAAEYYRTDWGIRTAIVFIGGIVVIATACLMLFRGT